jgi:hypothetical protein
VLAFAVKLTPLPLLLTTIGVPPIPIEPLLEVKIITGAVIVGVPPQEIEPVEVSENVCAAPDAEDEPRLTAPVLLK